MAYHLTSEDQLFASVIDGILLKWIDDNKAAADSTSHLDSELKHVVGTYDNKPITGVKDKV